MLNISLITTKQNQDVLVRHGKNEVGFKFKSSHSNLAIQSNDMGIGSVSKILSKSAQLYGELSCKYFCYKFKYCEDSAEKYYTEYIMYVCVLYGILFSLNVNLHMSYILWVINNHYTDRQANIHTGM